MVLGWVGWGAIYWTMALYRDVLIGVGIAIAVKQSVFQVSLNAVTAHEEDVRWMQLCACVFV